ncbi:hypothetical protein A0H76_126 [Hepatospora eriocheir]|uniref:Uncharacterized protein n=1 Tax=Hepatospora eriocheir TaxID=1081669 RepID=A0A1X0QJ74_9MICR|nr:hypothetical protein A0H76_126 [Hepatospora eriocheir]
MRFIRKCDFTNYPILPNDCSSVQICLAQLDGEGKATENISIIDICGSVRKSGKVDRLLYESEC